MSVSPIFLLLQNRYTVHPVHKNRARRPKTLRGASFPHVSSYTLRFSARFFLDLIAMDGMYTGFA